MDKFEDKRNNIEKNLEEIKYRVFLFVNKYWKELYKPNILNLSDITDIINSEDETEEEEIFINFEDIEV